MTHYDIQKPLQQRKPKSSASSSAPQPDRKPRNPHIYDNEIHGMPSSEGDDDEVLLPTSADDQTKPPEPLNTLQDVLDEISDVVDAADCDDDKRLSDEARQLMARLESDLTRWQRESRSAKWEPSRLIPETDAVLAYCISDMAGAADLRDQLFSSALARYIACSDAYDAVLDDAIATKLREAATERIAWRKYLEGSNPTARDDWDVFLKSRNNRRVLPTGIESLDNALGGGVEGITMIGGDQSSGKTSLCLQVMVTALRADSRLGCVYYTIDQSKTKTFRRLDSLVTGISGAVLDQPPQERPSETNQQIKEAQIEIRENLMPRVKFVENANLPENERLPLETLTAVDNEFRRNADVDHVLVIVDLFQSLTEICQRGSGKEADEYCLAQIKRFQQRSRTEACPEGYPIILVSEVRKDRIELLTDDMRGSARLGSTPDNIVLLWPPPGTAQACEVVRRTFRVIKGQEGDHGIDFDLEFHHKTCKFSEVASTAQPKDGKARARRTQRSSGRRGKAM